VAEAKPFLGGLVEGSQERTLPIAPDAGADRADVDDGQRQQQAQTLWALHLADEVVDRLGVGEIALERSGGQQEVMADEPGDRLGFRRVEAEPRAEPQRDRRAELAVIAAAALGDVVQQHRDVKDAT